LRHLPSHRFHRLALAVAASTVVASLAACANYSGITPQAAVRPAASLGLDAASTAPRVAADWWRGFQDPQLDQLVAQALQGSPSLKLAQARLRRAQAATDAIHAADLPQVSAGVDASHQKFTANGLYPAPLAGNIYDTGTAQLSASWAFRRSRPK